MCGSGTDLRTIDNEVLTTAISVSSEVYTVYCFDPREYGRLSIGTSKTSAFRAQFLLETLGSLRLKMRKLGGDLMILYGNPEIEIPKLAKTLSVNRVFAERTSFYKDVAIEQELESSLWSMGTALKLIWHSTLFHVDDIPWPIAHLPETFTEFRKELESTAVVREMAVLPEFGDKLRTDGHTELPTLKMLGLTEPPHDDRGVMSFKGGEQNALARLKYYLWETDHVSRYKETRNGLVGADYSTKLSPWLALGAISPKTIYYELKSYEEERVRNDSTYWLYFELLWRDYFRFIAKKHGSSLVEVTGIKQKGDFIRRRPFTF